MASRVDELLCGNPIISHSNSPIGATLRSSAIIASGYQWRRRGAQWCTRGAQCAQWYPSGTHIPGEPKGTPAEPSGIPVAANGIPLALKGIAVPHAWRARARAQGWCHGEGWGKGERNG